MSYILEALRKSEQERGQTGSPTVQTIHTSSLQYQQQKHSIWPYVLTAAVIINMIVLGYFVIDSKQQPVQTAVQQTTDVTAHEMAATSPVAAPQTTVAQAVVPNSHNKPRPAPARPVNTPAAPATRVAPAYESISHVVHTPAVDQPDQSNNQFQRHPRSDEPVIVSELYDLPVEMQASIPDMTFSAHVYSSNPAQRSVVINGDFMEEGDMLTASIRLDEITNDGVIFDYQGTLFRSNVVSGWRVN